MESQLKDVYAMITNRIITQLEQGVVPWHQPWTAGGLPQNFITRKSYRGINLWLLTGLGYPTNYFLTFRQAKDIGASIRKGEKAHLVVFWKMVEVTADPNTSNPTEVVRKPFLRYYMVFNIAQCIGIPEEKILVHLNVNDPIAICEEIVDTMPNRPDILHRESEAYYHIEEDYVNMPRMETFESSEGYYHVLWHELVHSTGSGSRLNRKEVVEKNRFGFEQYSIEELTAEMGACYLSSFAGIEQSLFQNSVAYIKHWLSVLKKDTRLMVYAGAQAQKAVDYILDIRWEDEADSAFLKTTAT